MFKAIILLVAFWFPSLQAEEVRLKVNFGINKCPADFNGDCDYVGPGDQVIQLELPDSSGGIDSYKTSLKFDAVEAYFRVTVFKLVLAGKPTYSVSLEITTKAGVTVDQPYTALRDLKKPSDFGSLSLNGDWLTDSKNIYRSYASAE